MRQPPAAWGTPPRGVNTRKAWARRNISEGIARHRAGHDVPWLSELDPDHYPRRKTSYEVYIESPHWQHVRALAIEYYGESCCLCNSTRRLNVHHRTYSRLGRERLADLVVLCRSCHARFHGTDGR